MNMNMKNTLSESVMNNQKASTSSYLLHYDVCYKYFTTKICHVITASGNGSAKCLVRYVGTQTVCFSPQSAPSVCSLYQRISPRVTKTYLSKCEERLIHVDDSLIKLRRFLFCKNSFTVNCVVKPYCENAAFDTDS